MEKTRKEESAISSRDQRGGSKGTIGIRTEIDITTIRVLPEEEITGKGLLKETNRDGSTGRIDPATEVNKRWKSTRIPAIDRLYLNLI